MIPILPPNSQKIYCAENFSNPIDGWLQQSVCFRPNQDYDMIWIFPKLKSVSGRSGFIIGFANPELISKDAFTINVTNDPQNSCIKTLSANCTVRNASYEWFLNGSLYSTLPNPTINTANQFGNIQLTLTLPNSPTNNSCGNGNSPCQLTATTSLPLCSPCTPIISPIGPIDYYTPVDGAPNGRLLTSSMTTGNQWYFNNVAIPNANGQTYDIKNEWGNSSGGDYYVINNGCTSNIVHVTFKHYGYGLFGEDNFDRLGAKIHPVQTSNYYCYNTTNNFIQQFDLGPTATYVWNFPVYFPTGGTANISLTPGSYNPNSNQAQVNVSVPMTTYTYVQGIANLNGKEIILDYYHTLSHPTLIPTTQQVCANAGQYIDNFTISSYHTLPGGSGFDWESYDFGTNGIIFSGPGAGQSAITIPGRSTPQTMIVKFSGPSTVTKHFYYNWGGCYKEEYSVYLTNICKSNEQIVNTEINMRPNPSSDRITISSTALISNIEISNLLNPVLKRIKVDNMKTLTVNVFDLKPGIYNCKITTDKGIENKKLIIQR